MIRSCLMSYINDSMLLLFLFQYYFNEGAYLPFMSIFNKALKDVLFIFCYLRKGQCFPFNVEY